MKQLGVEWVRPLHPLNPPVLTKLKEIKGGRKSLDSYHIPDLPLTKICSIIKTIMSRHVFSLCLLILHKLLPGNFRYISTNRMKISSII